MLNLDQAMLIAIELYEVGQDARRFDSQHVGFLLFLGGRDFGLVVWIAVNGLLVAGIGFRRHFARLSMRKTGGPSGLGFFAFALPLAFQKRDAGALVQFPEPLEIVDQINELIVGLAAGQVPFTRLGKQRRQVGDSIKVGFVNAAPGQRVVQRAFAEFFRIAIAGQRDVGRDAAQLGGAPVDAEELGHGQLDLAQFLFVVGEVVVQVEQVLNGALAERGFTQNDAPPVVLDGRGEDFRRRSAGAVDQHGQRTVPGHARLAIGFHRDTAVGIANLNDRSGVDEQPGHGGCLDQRTAAVAAQIDDNAFDAVGAQLVDQAAHVTRARAVVRFVARSPAEVHIENGHVDHADLRDAVTGFDFFHRGLGCLFFELDLVAHDVDDLRGALHAGLCRQDFESYESLALAPDQVDHVVQPPADHVDEFVFALGHADDSIAGLQPAVQVGGTAGNHFGDFHVFVLTAQQRTYTVQRELHRNFEVLGQPGRHV